MNPDQSGHPGELTDNDLDQLLAAANEELLAHIKAVADPTSTLVAIMARTAPPASTDDTISTAMGSDARQTPAELAADVTPTAVRPSKQEDYDGELTDLYRKYEGKVLSFLLNMGLSQADAEDALNESFLVIWRYWHKLRDNNPHLYLYQVARNQVMRLRRSQSRKPEHLMGDPPAPVTAELAVITTDFTSQVVDREMMRWALQKLTERERAAVLLRYYVGYNVAETATIMDIKTGTVKRYAVDGLGKLNRALTGSGLRIRDEAQLDALFSCL
jgi:RNA polymerase sigma factor (sigma-70 family)